MTSDSGRKVRVGAHVAHAREDRLPPSAPRLRECGTHLERIGIAEHRLSVHQAEELCVVDEPGELARRLLDDPRLDRRGHRRLEGPVEPSVAARAA